MAKIDIFYSKNSEAVLPSSDYVQIWVSEFSSDKQGRVFLSPELMTENEIDYHFNQLKNQLNETHFEAKNFIKKMKDAKN